MIASIVGQDGFLSRKTDDNIWGKGWMCFKEGNLRSTGLDHPHVLKGGLVRKKTVLDEWRMEDGTQGERRIFHPWKKTLAVQKDYKVM